MPDINTAQFNAPIPGQSLTTELGNRPWEKPAKFTNPNDALNFYMEQLAIPDTTASMLEVLEQGFPATDLVDAITLGGVLQGLHTIDVAVLLNPIINPLSFVKSNCSKLTSIDFIKSLIFNASLHCSFKNTFILNF